MDTIRVDNTVRTNDQLFKNLQRVVNSPGVVELNMVAATTSVAFENQAGTAMARAAGAINGNGFTLPSKGTDSGKEGLFSTERGVTQVFVIESLPQDRQAATVAAELGAHALPALLGNGASQPNDAVHRQVEAPLRQAARANAQRP